MKMIKYNNGLVLLVDKLKKTNKVSMSVNVNVGAFNDPVDKLGLAHLLEHMMFTGTDTKSNEDIFKEYAKYDINFNATTGYSVTRYYITAVRKYFNKGVDIIVDQFNNCKFTEENLKKEKSIVTDELEKGRSTDRLKFLEHINSIYFKDTLREREIIGTKKSIKSVELKDVENFKNKYYVPNNIIVSFAGDISIKEAKKIVKRFGFVKQNESMVDAYKEAERGHYITNKKIVYNKPVEQDYIDILMPCLSLLDTDIAVQDLFYNLFRQRINFTLRQKYALVYGAEIDASTVSGYGSARIGFSTNPNNITKAITALNKLVKDIKENGFTQKEIDDSKLSEEIFAISLTDSSLPVSIFNAYYTMALDKKVTYADRVKEYVKVDNAMLIEFANKHLKLDNALLALMTAKTDGGVLDKIKF